MVRKTIYLQSRAPTKPDWGQPCNGCGVCCATEPCPIGVLVSRRRQGACTALRWNVQQQRYHCGVLVAVQRWAVLRSLVTRWIAAGQGCDCSIEIDNSDEVNP
ncbi:hypothetical protein KIK84_03680 [Curvibacter sp. CHRR-16]|nr:hypothetical protein [Curvibacter sp. CHRR-16]